MQGILISLACDRSGCLQNMTCFGNTMIVRENAVSLFWLSNSDFVKNAIYMTRFSFFQILVELNAISMLRGTFKIVQNRMACADIYEIVWLKLRGFFCVEFCNSNKSTYVSNISCFLLRNSSILIRIVEKFESVRSA